MLAENIRLLIQNRAVCRNHFFLIFFRKHLRSRIVQPGHRIRTEFSQHDGLVRIARMVAVQFVGQNRPRRREIPLLAIPAVVPVQHQHIAQSRDLAGLHGGFAVGRKGYRTVLGIQFPHQFEQRFEVHVRARFLAGRFVRHTPGNNAGVVLIPGNHLPQDIPVVLLGLQRFPCWRSNIHPHTGSGKSGVHSNSRRFVNNQDSHSVTQLHHFLAVRVMACPERVCAHPLHQRQILDLVGFAEPPPDYRYILVLSKPFQINFFTVQIQAAAANINCPEAKPFGIPVFPSTDIPQDNLQGVQLRRFRAPGRNVAKNSFSLKALSFPKKPLAVPHRNSTVSCPKGGDFIVNHTVHGSKNTDAFNMRPRHPVKGYRPQDTAVVKKIKIGEVQLPGRNTRCPALLYSPAGKRSVVNSVVRQHRQPVVSLPHMLRYIKDKRQKSAAVGPQPDSVPIDLAAVGHTPEMQQETLAVFCRGGFDLPLIYNNSHMLPDLPSLINIVIRAGDRHRTSVFQRHRRGIGFTLRH